MNDPSAPADPWLQITPQEEKLGLQANLCEARLGLACQSKIHIAVFFDGMCLNMQSGKLPASNVGRLYLGFSEAPVGALTRKHIYVPGLGTDMDIDDWRRAKEQAEALLKKKMDAAKDAPVDTVKGAVKETAEREGKEALKEMGSGRNIRQAAGEAINDTVQAAPGEIKNAFGKAISSPYKSGLKVLKNAAFDITRASLEHINWVRDSKWLAKALNVGVQPRLSQAMQKFKQHVNAVPTKLVEIQVSVYGCDWGGGMARAFLNNLCGASVQGDAMSASLQWQLPNGRRVPLRLMFVGLFDSLGYRADGLVAKGVELIPIIGVKNEISDVMELPRGVENAVHFIAGHEVFNRVHSLGGAELQPLTAPVVNSPPRSERIFPGTTWDVSGAYATEAQNRSNAIGQVCLVEMWRLSRLRGVPFDGLEATKAAAKQFGADFDLAGQSLARGSLRAYVAEVGKWSKEFGQLRYARDAIDMMGGNNLAKALFPHRMLQVAWLSQLLWANQGKGLKQGTPVSVEDSFMQGGVDFSRLILKDDSMGYKEIFLTGVRVNALTDYEKVCLELFRLAERKLKDRQQWVFDGSVHTVFGRMVHLPHDKPEDELAYLVQPNLPHLLRERHNDAGEDLRESTFNEKMQQFGERYLGFKPPEKEQQFDSEEAEANRKRWDRESQAYQDAQPKWPR